MGIFEKVNFKSHSGLDLDFKIECDALTDSDWETIAHIIRKRFRFQGVVGIPRGGTKLANKLYGYIQPGYANPFIVVDDVLTTGGSMKEWIEKVEKEQKHALVIGVVVFARRKVTPSDKIYPIFQMWSEYEFEKMIEKEEKK